MAATAILAAVGLGTSIYSAKKSDEANQAATDAANKAQANQQGLLDQAKADQAAQKGQASAQAAAKAAKLKQQQQANGTFGRSGTILTGNGGLGTPSLGGAAGRTTLLGM